MLRTNQNAALNGSARAMCACLSMLFLSLFINLDWKVGEFLL